MRGKTGSSNSDIFLESGKGDNLDKIMVGNLGKYLKNSNGQLWTTIIYFKDKTWEVHDVNLNLIHVYEAGISSQYKYSLKITKQRGRVWSGNRRTIYLEERIRNEVDNPRKLWHQL